MLVYLRHETSPVQLKKYLCGKPLCSHCSKVRRSIWLEQVTYIQNTYVKKTLPENICIVYFYPRVIPYTHFFPTRFSFYKFIPQLKSFNIERWENKFFVQIHNSGAADKSKLFVLNIA